MMKEQIQKLRDELYDELPTGILDAFDLLTIIKNHIVKLDKVLEDFYTTGRPKTTKENAISLYQAKGQDKRLDIVTRCDFFENRFHYNVMQNGDIQFLKFVNKKMHSGRTIKLRKLPNGTYKGAIVAPNIKPGVFEIENFESLTDKVWSKITIKTKKDADQKN